MLDKDGHNRPVASDLLTVIITTSVTPSAPSTELVSSVLLSFNRHCPELTGCKTIVVFDSYDHVVAEARLKKGCVTPEQAATYPLYRKKIKDLVLSQHFRCTEGLSFTYAHGDAEYGSSSNTQNTVGYTVAQTLDRKVTFIEPSRRLGFGLAVRSALRITETPYVWVQQHDWALVCDLPIHPLLMIMSASGSDSNAPIKCKDSLSLLECIG